MKTKETSNGVMIFPENDIVVGKSILEHSEYNKNQIDFLSSLVEKGDFFIDVGAGIGTTTIPLAKKVGSEGYVVALEAQLNLYYCLCGNISLNNISHVHAFNRAASDKSNSVFYYPKFDFDSNKDFGSIKLSSFVNYEDSKGLYDCPIASIALDDFGFSNPKIIKVDVNGMEAVVLNGLRKTIKKFNPMLFIEFSNNWKYVIDFLTSVEYQWKVQEIPCFENRDGLFIFAYSKYIDNIDVPYVADLKKEQYKNLAKIFDEGQYEFSFID